MSLLGLSSEYRKAAKEGMNVLATGEARREQAEDVLEEQEKGQRLSMTASGAGLAGALGMGAAKTAFASGGGMAAAGAIAPWLVAGAGVGYLLSRIF